MKNLSKKMNSFLLPCGVWIAKNLFPFWQTFSVRTKVTFGLTNGAGIVGHDKFANLFGTARELYGLSRIPGFEKDAGTRYLLKTGDATYQHHGEFIFGDEIKTIINVIEVSGSIFKLRGLFVNNRTGKVCVSGSQTIIYTKPNGRPTRIHRLAKFLLTLACRPDQADVGNDVKIDMHKKPEVFQRRQVVTTDMINAEQNVSHNVYVTLLTGTIELFLLRRDDGPDCTFKVVSGFYQYGRDFYFGDEITIKLFIVSADDKEVVFGAEFRDQAGNLHTSGTQKIVFADNKGVLKSVPEKLAAAIPDGLNP